MRRYFDRNDHDTMFGLLVVLIVLSTFFFALAVLVYYGAAAALAVLGAGCLVGAFLTLMSFIE